MIKRLAPLALLAVFLPGCAIHQNVRPVEGLTDQQVCLIENPAVRSGFLTSYHHVLTDKGYAVKQLPAAAAVTDCRVTSTYTASWRWDLAMYMTVAEIRVFVDGKEKGTASYDSSRGGANPNKFIDADKKIAELVNQLFPGGPATR